MCRQGWPVVLHNPRRKKRAQFLFAMFAGKLQFLPRCTSLPLFLYPLSTIVKARIIVSRHSIVTSSNYQKICQLLSKEQTIPGSYSKRSIGYLHLGMQNSLLCFQVVIVIEYTSFFIRDRSFLDILSTPDPRIFRFLFILRNRPCTPYPHRTRYAVFATQSLYAAGRNPPTLRSLRNR